MSSMRENHKRALMMSALLCGTVPGVAFAQDPSADQAGRDAGGGAEIIVTARRREERLQDVPVAVTALGADSIAKRQVNTLDNLGAVVPNLVTTPSSGSASNARIFMRGMGQSESIMPTADPAVGLYVDDVYLARMNGANMNLFDIDRIEVLRGPQGTLYGRNSMTGAIKIVTKKPGDTFEARASASYGSRDLLDARASVSGPIGGGWAVGASGAYSRNGGYMHRYSAVGVDSDQKLGDRSFGGGRLVLRYYGAENFELVAQAWATRDRGDAIYATPVSATGAVLTGGDLYTTLTTRDLPADADQYGGSLHMTYDLGGATLKSITAYRHVKNVNSVDVSGRNVWYIDTSVKSRELSQELQLSGKAFGDAVDWIVGGYYLHEVGDNSSFNKVGPLTSLQVYRVKTDSLSVYGQANVEIVRNLNLTLGGRYTSDKKDFDGSTTSTGPLWVSGSARLSRTFSQFTPRIGLDFKATPDLLLYAYAAKGFKSGGFQGRAFSVADMRTSYDPESVWTYEAGFKSDWFDRKVTLNADYFINDFRNLQLNSINTATGGGTIIQNAAQARISGLEVELSARPIKGLNLFVNVATLDDKYKKLAPNVQNVTLASELAVTPSFTLQTGFDGTIQTGAGAIGIGGDFQHTSAYHPGTTNDDVVKIRPLDLLNGYIKYTSPNGAWDIGLYGRNLMDKKYWFTAFALSSFKSVLAAEPRTLRVSFNVRF